MNHCGAFGTAEIKSNVDHIHILGNNSVLVLQDSNDTNLVIDKESKEI